MNTFEAVAEQAEFRRSASSVASSPVTKPLEQIPKTVSIDDQAIRATSTTNIKYLLALQKAASDALLKNQNIKRSMSLLSPSAIQEYCKTFGTNNP